MKKTLTLALIVCSLSVAAQTSKGSFMIGGNGSLIFNNNRIDAAVTQKTSSFNVSPIAGFFVAKNFNVGLSLPFELSWSKSTLPSSSEEYKGNGRSTGVAPFVRYYIPVKSWFIVAEGTYGWYYSKNSIEIVNQTNGNVIGTYENSSHNKRYSFAAGPAFFLSPYTSIEILATYQHIDLEATNQSRFYVSVGFQIYLPSKK
ncbi:MAG TPA: outer membrane beta-barrel protein [Chryseolinea sp.]|nr:outer membrane beta-barrel protein [Chryseolinea sp.]